MLGDNFSSFYVPRVGCQPLARPASSMGQHRKPRPGMAWRKMHRVRFAEEIQVAFEASEQFYPPGATTNSESTEGRSQLDICPPSTFSRCCYSLRGGGKIAISGMHPTRAGISFGACLVAHTARQIPGGCDQSTRSANGGCEVQEYAECPSCSKGAASRSAPLGSAL